MKNFTGPIIGLHIMQLKIVFLDITLALLHFLHLSMRAKTTDEAKTTKPHALIILEDIIKPAMVTKTINAHTDFSARLKTTGIITPVVHYTKTAMLLISLSMLTKTENEVLFSLSLSMKEASGKFPTISPEQSKILQNQ